MTTARPFSSRRVPRGLLGPCGAAWVLAAAAALACAGELRVRVDPRVELAGLAQLAAGEESAPPDFRAPARPHLDWARREGAALRQHPAARLHAHAPPREFPFLARVELLSYFDDPPGLEPRWEPPSGLVELAGGRGALERWLESLRALAREPLFAEFLARARVELEPAAERLRGSIKRGGLLARAELYAGWPADGRYDLAVSAFAGDAAVVNVVVHHDSGTAIFSLLGVALDGDLEELEETLPATVWHELSHGLFDWLSDLHAPELELRRPPGHEDGSCYGAWRQCVKENVARAVVLRLIFLESGEEAARRRLEEERRHGMRYLEPMAATLERYERERGESPTLAHVYGELLKALPAPADAGPELPLAALRELPRAFPTRAWSRRVDSRLAAALAPRPAPLLRGRRAALLYHLEDLDGALAESEAALAADPGDATARMVRRLLRLAGADEDLRLLREDCRSRWGPSGCAGLAEAPRPAFRGKDDLRSR